MPDPRPFIAVFIILFILFSPEPQGRALQPRNILEEVLEREEHSLLVLNKTRYGDFNPLSDKWLNVSGFTNESDFAWRELEKAQDRARQLSKHALGLDAEQASPGEGIKEPVVTEVELYKNITGVVHGSWVRSPLSSEMTVPKLNMTDYSPEGPFGPMPVREFGRNLTGNDGALTIRFTELEVDGSVERGLNHRHEEVDVVRLLWAQASMQDADSMGNGWELQMHGVHFLETGNVVMTTTSNKFAGIFALPHMTLSENEHDAAQRLLNRTLRETIDNQEEGVLRTLNPWTSYTDGTSDTPFSSPNCELVVYMQQHVGNPSGASTKDTTSGLLGFIEQELRSPSGAFVPPAHDMQFVFLGFSPDCGFAVESKGPPEYIPQDGNHLIGPKIEVEYIEGRHHLEVFASVLALQLWLLTNQMREASTPSTRSRISFYTVAMLALGDGFTTMSFSLISLFIPNLWILLIATSFLAFLSVSFFGMRFLMDIWSVQAPERERRERQRRATASTATPSAAGEVPAAAQVPILTLAGADALPLPATARRPIDTGATPIILPPDQDEPAEENLPTTAPGANATPTPATAATGRTSGFGALYTRFYFLLLATLFISLNATSWPASLRRGYFTLLAFAYLSFWTPQIVRNTMRNCRRALRWDFVIGQSILRLVPFAYFYGYSSNVLFAKIDLFDFAVLAAWVWIQGVVLVSQEIVGPRWFVKTSWVPPAYDYHPLLRQDEEGGNLPIGFSQAAALAPESPTSSGKPGEAREKGKHVFDCAICMQDLEVDVIEPGGVADGGLAGAGGLLARRGYMVTPCRHIFHSGCLEGWMKYRLQCPICREELPPL